MQIGRMDEKTRKYYLLFKQESFVQHFGTRGEIDLLLEALSVADIDRLINLNTVFIRTSSPSSKVNLTNLDKGTNLTLINFDQDYYSKLYPEEVVGIWLHEIGHVFNSGLNGMDGEYVADNFAKKKGYGKWISSSLDKGIEYNWLGFNPKECKLRKQNLLIK